jgi:hypothetical protein
MLRKNARVRIAVIFLSLAIAAFGAVKFVSYAQRNAKPAAPTAPAVTATETLTDPVGLGTNNGDTKAQPGETLLATVTITNTGGTDATGVTLSDSPSDPLSPNGTNGTFAIGPAAAPDTYNNLIGNVNLSIPTGAGSLLSNDVNPSGVGTLTITGFGDTVANANQNPAGTPVLLAGIGTVNVKADGSFDFDGLTGITAQKQFFYTLSNGGTLTSIGTVTVNYQAANIWFINNAGGACASNCDGRLTHPFTSIANFQSAQGGGAGKPAIGDTIFLTESAAGYTGPITLLNSQKLIGQDATATILAITALTAPPGTNQLPTTNPASPFATINASASNGINLAQGNTIRGLTISGTTSAKISGTGFGTLVLGNSALPDVTLSGTGQALNLTTGTLSVAGGLVSLASTSSTAQGINLAGVADSDGAGGGAFSFGSTTISGSTTQGVLIGTTTADLNLGNTSITGGTDGISFQNNSAGTRTTGTLGVSAGTGNAFLHGAGGGNVTVTGAATLSSALSAVSVSAPGAANAISLGVTSATSTTAGQAGINWAGVSGATLGFTSLAVDTNAGTGMNLTGGGTITVTGGSGSINATPEAAPAIVANAVTLNYTSTGGMNSSGGTNGISLTNVAGTSSFGGGSMTGSSGPEILMSGGAATVTFNGVITQTTGSHVVDIQNKTGGTVNLGGAITSSNGIGQGIFLNSNTGATINFTGGLNLSTGGNAAFTATGGGTVSATQNNTTIVNTLTTTTGTALNVTDTIGASGLTFRSITAGTAASGPANAIILNNTGANGGLTVTGNGSAGTGGTIQKTTGSSISIITGTKNLNLSFMNIQNSSAGAINGTGVNGFSLTSCSITGNVTGVNDGQSAAVILTDTTNTVAFISDTVTGTTGANGFNAELHSSAASTAAITTLTVTGGSYSNSAGNGGFLIDTKNTAKIGAAFFSGVTFSNNFSKGLQVQQNDAAIVGDSTTAALGSWSPTPPNGSITVTGCTFTGNNVAAEMDGGTGAAGAIGSTYYRFVNNGTAANPIVGIPITTPGTGSSHALVFANGSDSGSTGTYKALISGNFLGSASQVASGKGNGMRIFMQGQQAATVTVVNNSVLNCPIGRGIEVSELGRPGAAFGQTPLDIKLTGNTVNPMDTTGFPLYAIYVGADAQGTGTSGSNVHAEIHGNTVPATAGCDTQCGPTIGMIAYETVSGATGTHTGTLLQTGPGGSVSADIAATNTGTSGKSCAFVNGGSLTLTATAPNTVAMLEQPSRLGQDMAFIDIAGDKASAPLGIDTAEIALAEPIENILGADVAGSEVIATPRQTTTEDKPSLIAELYDKLTNEIEPTVEAQSGPVSGTLTTSPTFVLPAGSSVTITYQLTVAPGPYAAGLNNLTDAATVSGSNFVPATPVPATGGTIPLDAAPSIAVGNTDSTGEAQPGTTITYAVSATNATIPNGQDATGVILTATIPANSVFDPGSSAAGWNCPTPNTANTTCTNTIGAVSAQVGVNTVTKNFAVDLTGNLPAATTTIANAANAHDDGTNGTNLTNPSTPNLTDTDNLRGLWEGTTGTDWFTATNWANSLPPTGGNVAVSTSAGSAPTISGNNSAIAKLFLNGKDLTIAGGSTLTINSSISIGGNKVVGTSPSSAGTLALVSPATISFTLNSGWVTTAMSRSFAGGAIAEPGQGVAETNAPTDALAAVFTYPVGTSTGYFPVDVTPTAGSNGTLTVQTFDGQAGVVPPLNPAKTLGRYWTLTDGSGITADVKFSYGPINVANGTTIFGTEANYKPQRVTGGVATAFADTCTAGTSCVDQTNHFIFMPQISTFAGNWTASELAPTAAMVGVSGRVISADGRAIRGVRVTLDDGTGHAMTMVTNAFGYYHFDEVQSGSTYLLNAQARGYTFTPRVVSVNDELTDVNLTALP